MDNQNYLENLIHRKELLKNLYEQNIVVINTLTDLGYMTAAANMIVVNKDIANRIDHLSSFILQYGKGESTDG